MTTRASLPADERLARALWSRVAEPCDPRVATLIERHGAAEALHVVASGHDPRHEALRDRLRAARPGTDLDVARRCGARLLVPGDAEWPAGVDDLGLDRPYCLWVRGLTDLAGGLSRSVSVVGSRAATDYGAHVATELAAGLATRGFVVVSGAAFGIDAAAHRGALAVEAPTVAVLAGGVDRAYPAAHAHLIGLVGESGGIISEAAPGSAPTKHRFLRRNRLIAALTRGTVVVEAGFRSGALSTARHADTLSRPLGAVPGPVTSAASAGCHELIRSGAVLVTDAADAAELCGDYGRDVGPVRRGPVRQEDMLLPQDRVLLDAMPAVRPQPVAAVAVTAGMTAGEARASATRLHQAGLAEVVSGTCRLSAEARRRRGVPEQQALPLPPDEG